MRFLNYKGATAPQSSELKAYAVDQKQANIEAARRRAELIDAFKLGGTGYAHFTKDMEEDPIVGYLRGMFGGDSSAPLAEGQVPSADAANAPVTAENTMAGYPYDLSAPNAMPYSPTPTDGAPIYEATPTMDTQSLDTPTTSTTDLPMVGDTGVPIEGAEIAADIPPDELAKALKADGAGSGGEMLGKVGQGIGYGAAAYNLSQGDYDAALKQALQTYLMSINPALGLGTMLLG
jgi:hypothetical protein